MLWYITVSPALCTVLKSCINKFNVYLMVWHVTQCPFNHLLGNKEHLKPDTSHVFCTNAFLHTLTHTYIETPQQEQRGLQAYREDQPQYGGSNKRPDAVRLRQDDDYSQRNQHGHP